MIPEIESYIKKLALENKKQEICGLIVLKSNGELMVKQCHNDSKNKRHHVYINEYDYLNAALTGKIIAAFHSHIGDVEYFSMFDRINCLHHKITFMLYHIGTDRFYYLDPDDAISYIDNKFELEKNDCYTLIRSYYQNELKINLPEFSDYSEFCNRCEDVAEFKKEYVKAGFTAYNNVNDIKKHDLLVLNYYRTRMPPHFAVYLGNGYILHHPRNSYPQINALTKIHLSKTMFFLRHKDA